MITRIFIAKVPEGLHDEFRVKFQEISVPLVTGYEGLQSVNIAGPSESNPDEFVMISVWKDQEALKNFVGPEWHKAHIPAGMEKYIAECQVGHYENINS